VAISKQDHEVWLTKKDKEVLETDCVAVKKVDWKVAQDALMAQKGTPNKPIVLGLDEVKGFRFDPGSADLTPDFKEKLEGDVLSKIKEVVQNYGIEVLEIVGHTDGKSVSSPDGNLDKSLNDLQLDLIDHKFVPSLKAGSNADLGLMRALSVASYLHDLTSLSEDPQIRSLVFRTYSAAQLIDPKEDVIRGAPDLDIGERRRIELRFTRKSISLRE
jgi:outer membrane protein OmpA-like peptidoglycan-associated protein